MRLIDACALQEEYKARHSGKRLLLIDVAPTVDAVPVRRGRWIDKYPNQNVVCRIFYCSECGKSFMVGLGLSFEEWKNGRNFCENCGADMREVSDGQRVNNGSPCGDQEDSQGRSQEGDFGHIHGEAGKMDKG